MNTYSQNAISILSEFAARKYTELNYPVGNFIESQDMFTMRKATQVADLINNFQHVFQQAGDLFIKKDASGNAKKTIDRMVSLAQQNPANIIDLLSEDDYHSLFDIAMNAYDSEDFDSAFVMMSAIVALFHNYVQPYIILASITWFQQGIEAAITIYEQLTKVIKNPLLYCSAADCYMTSEDPHRKCIAKSLLEEAISLANSDASSKETYKDLVVDIKKMLSSL